MLAFGKTDIGFGQQGRAITEMPSAPAAAQVADVCVCGGGIVAGGDRGLVKYTTAGAVDPIFGQDGRVDLSGVSFRAQAGDADGNLFILLSGASGTSVSEFDRNGNPVDD